MSQPASAKPGESLLVENAEPLLQILDAIADLVLVKGKHSRILWANRAFREYYGMSNEQLRDIIDAPFVEVDVTAQYIRDDARVFATGETLDIAEEPIQRPDGTVQIFHTVKSAIRDASGAVVMTVGVSRNITEQKRTREDLARHRDSLERLVDERTAELKGLTERLQTIISALNEGIIALGSDGTIRSINRVAWQMTGWTDAEAFGRPIGDVLHFVREAKFGGEPASARLDRAALLALSVGGDRIDGFVTSRTGTQRLVALQSASMGAGEHSGGTVLVLRDISDERELAEQRLRAQKLESVGLLAGGIAHDFNNALAGILGGVSVARLRLSRGLSAVEVLQQTEAACLRAQSLTTQLLTFARGGAPVKKLLDPVPLVRSAAELALRGSNIVLAFEASPECKHIEADEGQLAQVVSNLVLNARQAIAGAGAGAGSVFIRVYNTSIKVAGSDGASPKEFVVVSVSDDGPGIATEHLARIFDPYFTTRSAGTGLGLTSVHSIVDRHQGQVIVGRAAEGGARFDVFLPASLERADAMPTVHAESGSSPACKILVLDDDSAIRRLLPAILTLLGHEAVAVGSSKEATDAHQRALIEQQPFDLAILDMTLPGDLDGSQVARLLRAQNPSLPIVAMSGYSVDAMLAQHKESGYQAALQKPFTTDSVQQALATALT